MKLKQSAFPIFFSVSGANVEFAESVWSHFPADWIYLYNKTGEEAAHIWDEISERELPKAKILVVFWSIDYITSAGCVRELLQAAPLIQAGLIRPVVIRVDDTALVWSDEIDVSTKDVFEALSKALDYRTSKPHSTVDSAVEIIARVSEPLLESAHPRLPRYELIQSMRAGTQLPEDRFKFYPSVWVSGFNGNGRETIVREYNRNFTPNGHAIIVEINEATIPRQLLLRLESEGLGATRERLLELQESVIEDDYVSIAACMERIYERGNYTVLRHSRIVDDQVELPEWLDDVVVKLGPDSRSKLFIVSQMPVAPGRRARCQTAMAVQRIPTIDEHILKEYAYQLIGYFDKFPNRWTEDVIDQVASAASGNIGFLVSLVRTASRIEDFDQLGEVIAATGAPMADQMTVYVRWAFSQLENFVDEQRALVFLNNVTPCDIQDLETALNPARPIQRVVGKLLELGLVEREGEGIYRLTPLLANRLSRDLISADLIAWQREAYERFTSTPTDFETADHEFLRIESRIQAGLNLDSGRLPANIEKFVSAAHWFQAGIRLYHARRHDPAYRMLKRAFNSRHEFAQATRTEIIRYYGLSATRLRIFPETEKCIQLLNSVHTTRSIGAFLQGNLHEAKKEYIEAVSLYEKALDLNEGKNSRIEHIYRPLIACILRTFRPNFGRAEKYALEYVKLKRTVFSLAALARVRLHWMYRPAFGDAMPANIRALYEAASEDLSRHPGVKGSHFELLAEEAEFEGDLRSALDYLDKAVAADPRPILHNERWQMMSKLGDRSIALRAVREMEKAKTEEIFSGNWTYLLPMLTETYARVLRAADKPLGQVNQFALGLPDRDIAKIVAKAKRPLN